MSSPDVPKAPPRRFQPTHPPCVEHDQKKKENNPQTQTFDPAPWRTTQPRDHTKSLCYMCGEAGHPTGECPPSQPQSKMKSECPNQPNKKRSLCYMCGEAGHTTSECSGAPSSKRRCLAATLSPPAALVPQKPPEEKPPEEPPVVLSASQQHAASLIDQGRNVFITGSAGTGKSLLLNHVVKALSQRGRLVAVTAMTGQAAVLVGGRTLHSWSGIGLGDEDAFKLLCKVRAKRDAAANWMTTHCLIVDEVSMLSRLLFEKLDFIARNIRHQPTKPFGGLQLILVGDFLQLPPINGDFCFTSPTWGRTIHQVVELKEVFRQKDREFVHALQQIRVGQFPPHVQQLFRQCLGDEVKKKDGIEPTQLFPTKREVSYINEQNLARLDGEELVYHSTDFCEAGLRALLDKFMMKKLLKLKIGAQVMCVVNVEKLHLVNGSRGVVVGFEFVGENSDTGTPLSAHISQSSPQAEQRWPLVKFNERTVLLLPQQQEMYGGSGRNRRAVASRSQVPLILAWAITIHKCQGMTIDRARLALGSVWDFGQVYTALSRVRSLDALSIKDVLKHPKAHTHALNFYRKHGIAGPAPAAVVKQSKAPVELNNMHLVCSKHGLVFALSSAIQPTGVQLKCGDRKEPCTVSLNWTAGAHTAIPAPAVKRQPPQRLPPQLQPSRQQFTPSQPQFTPSQQHFAPSQFTPSQPQFTPSQFTPSQQQFTPPTGCGLGTRPRWHPDMSRARNRGCKAIPQGEPGCLMGFTFVFTGALDSLDREEAEDLVRKYGGRVTKAISGRTSFIVAGHDAGQAKLRQAKQKKKPIISEDVFFQLIENPDDVPPPPKNTRAVSARP